MRADLKMQQLLKDSSEEALATVSFALAVSDISSATKDAVAGNWGEAELEEEVLDTAAIAAADAAQRARV